MCRPNLSVHLTIVKIFHSDQNDKLQHTTHELKKKSIVYIHSNCTAML